MASPGIRWSNPWWNLRLVLLDAQDNEFAATETVLATSCCTIVTTAKPDS